MGIDMSTAQMKMLSLHFKCYAPNFKRNKIDAYLKLKMFPYKPVKRLFLCDNQEQHEGSAAIRSTSMPIRNLQQSGAPRCDISENRCGTQEHLDATFGSIDVALRSTNVTSRSNAPKWNPMMLHTGAKGLQLGAISWHSGVQI